MRDAGPIPDSQLPIPAFEDTRPGMTEQAFTSGLRGDERVEVYGMKWSKPMAKKAKTNPAKTAPVKTGGVAVSAEAQGGLALGEWAPTYAEVEAAANMVWDYAAKVMVPRRLAEERRRAGDPKASIRDYACRCPLSVADGLPRCFGYRKTCRFRDRYVEPPRVGNDPLRHKAEKEEYSKLIELTRAEDEAALRLVIKIMAWHEREAAAKRRRAQCADA